MLGVKYGSAYEDEKEKYAYLTCYGPAVSRIFGSIIIVHGDDKGLVLPPRIAPTHIAIVPIVFSNKPTVNEKVMKVANKIKKELEDNLSEEDKRAKSLAKIENILLDVEE